jgi:anti-sigma regulatory factor (Ser/Thr protein kinase)
MAVIDGARYTAGQWQLEEGDRVLLYTDGLIEMPLRNCGRRIAPEELKGIIEQLIANTPDMPVSMIIRQLTELLADMCTEEIVPGGLTSAQDDVTLVGLEIEHKDQTSQIVLRPRDLDDVCDAIEQLYQSISSDLQANHFEAADIDITARLRVVLEEMILNAWKHGGHQTPGLPIAVRWRCRNDLVLEAIDQGEGFDPRAIADPRYGDRRLAPTGRGILLIRRSCDAVRWKSGGRHIVASIMRKLHPRDARHRPARDLSRAWCPTNLQSCEPALSA